MWKDIEGFEGRYQVSDEGEIISLRKGLKMHQKDNGRGYMQVILYKDGQYYHKYTHRLVAEAFIPNPNNYPCINHKDEDRKNNKAENLEWCTYQYNINYGNRLKNFLDTISKQGYLIGEESYNQKVIRQREKSHTLAEKERRKKYVAAHREEINAWMREYRQRRKAEGRPLP